jgi:hypothetical protein
MPNRLLSPTLFIALFLVGYLGVALAREQWNPSALAMIGAGFRNGAPMDKQAEGYDGQFAYAIALDPNPANLTEKLDVPAYRYQRIFYPLLARIVGLGQPALIPWALLLVNLLAHLGGTALLEAWLTANGVSRWYALTYAFWAGLAIPVRGDLTEPLCYALVVAAFWAQQRGRTGWAALALGLAIFTKETALIFLAAQWAAALFERQWRTLLIALAPLVPFAFFQGWLYLTFGAIGLTSGGYMATPFELIPYNGLWRVFEANWRLFLIYGALFGPMVITPSVWGIVATLRRLWARDFSPVVWALAANAAIIPFTPFSTFREPFGMIRFVDGLVLATLLFGARIRSKRVLNYSLFWCAALVLVIRS